MKPESFYKNLEMKNYLGKRHLDFGCGRGEFLRFIAGKFPKRQFVGIEIDKEKLKIARNKNNRKNIQYRLSSKITGKFDLITMIFVPHEIKNLKKILKSIYNHLEDEGKILVYDFKKSNKKAFKRLYNKKPQKISFKEFYEKHNTWTLPEFENIMKSIGFKTIKLRKDKEPFFVYVGEKER